MPSLVVPPVEAAGPPKRLLGPSISRPQKSHKPDIIDIRQSVVDLDLKHEISTLLRPDEGPRRLPTLLLYDEPGLQLFEQVSLPVHGGIAVQGPLMA